MNKKTLKFGLIAIILIIVMVVLSSCGCGDKSKRKAPQRIKLIESTITNNERVNLISIDGKLYATTNNGGIIKIED